ncbi:DUF6345 domain-containing protein [Methylocucumis oryzae]|uniref:Uncharacterized protein n=1 Tax=Methylocucumis oryzae TaxID=1632867 RepID=A0A0F3ILG3_9GAMM|nr:DUF6345 domain-containing protein [Methylocucumis oryzae]KJV07358.1 hypothetical protein VZ94_05245 [Methylocucumis oryzae]
MLVNQKKLVTGLCLATLTLASAASYAGDREIGGYVDKAESRFVRNVWNFIKNFQGWQNIGSHRYKETQYYYNKPFVMDSSHQFYVDKMDLAYIAGHGSDYYIETDQSLGEGVDLRTVPAYGDLANNGDLEFMIIESCYTVTTAPEHADWWSPYSNMFQGLHQLVGFHTLSNSDNGIPNNYANKLKANGGVWQSWFDAVNEERYWIFNPTNDDGSPYPGLASAIMYTSTENDRLGAYAADPAGGTAGMKTWWQY